LGINSLFGKDPGAFVGIGLAAVTTSRDNTRDRAASFILKHFVSLDPAKAAAL
jgi:hypothetical protein